MGLATAESHSEAEKEMTELKFAIAYYILVNDHKIIMDFRNCDIFSITMLGG